MPKYDADRFHPPAAVAVAHVRDRAGNVVREVELLIDTGADLTLLPRSALDTLAVEAIPSNRIELEGFEGTRASFDIVEADLLWLGRSFRGRFALIDSVTGILGRDVLNGARLVFDGPAQSWSEHIGP